MDAYALNSQFYEVINFIQQGGVETKAFGLNLLEALLWLEIVFFGLWYAANGGARLTGVLKKTIFILLLIQVVNFSGTVFGATQNFFQTGGEALASKQTFSQSGQQNATPFNPLLPASIIASGYESLGDWFVYFEDTPFWRFAIAALIRAILAGVVLIAFVIMTLQAMLIQIEWELLKAASLLFLPFAAFRPTKFLAERLLGACLASGGKLLGLGFVYAVLNRVFGPTRAPMDGDISAELNYVIFVLLIFVVVMKAPSLVSNFLAGAANLSVGDTAPVAGAMREASSLGGRAAVGTAKIGYQGAASTLGMGGQITSAAAKTPAVAAAATVLRQAGGKALSRAVPERVKTAIQSADTALKKTTQKTKEGVRGAVEKAPGGQSYLKQYDKLKHQRSEAQSDKASTEKTNAVGRAGVEKQANEQNPIKKTPLGKGKEVASKLARAGLTASSAVSGTATRATASLARADSGQNPSFVVPLSLEDRD